MTTSPVEMEYAKDPETGQPVHIGNAANGLDCGLVCGRCDQVVLAVQGQVRQHHFRHYVPSSCTGWTPHGMALDVLEMRCRRAIQSDHAVPATVVCSCGQPTDVQNLLNINGRSDDLHRETPINRWLPESGRFTPDLTITGPSDPITLLEVVYSHPPGQDTVDLDLPLLEVPVETEDDTVALGDGPIRGGTLHNRPCPHPAPSIPPTATVSAVTLSQCNACYSCRDCGCASPRTEIIYRPTGTNSYPSMVRVR